MAKIDITRTELVWPGKYSEDGTLKEAPRVSLPFQVIETVNESRASREAKKGQTMSLFDTYEGNEGDTFEAGWHNKLIWGDNLLVMGSLLGKFAGRSTSFTSTRRSQLGPISRSRRRLEKGGWRLPKNNPSSRRKHIATRGGEVSIHTYR